jgi:voltage-gated potassium channel
MFEKFVDLLTELEFGGTLMKTKISLLKDHFIICGAGRVGIHAAKKLKEKGKKFVIIESDKKNAEAAKEKGFLVIEDDCLKEDTLKKARIDKAKGLLACMGRDDANIFVTLTAKDLNPNIKVASRVNNLDVIGEFKRAGADYIVAPEVTGGFELAEKILEF